MWYECSVVCDSCLIETQIRKVCLNEQEEMMMETQCQRCGARFRTVEAVSLVVSRAFKQTVLPITVQ